MKPGDYRGMAYASREMAIDALAAALMKAAPDEHEDGYVVCPDWVIPQATRIVDHITAHAVETVRDLIRAEEALEE